MELGHLTHRTYPRAIQPSLEGQIRQEAQGGVTPDPASTVKKGASGAVHRQQSHQSQHDVERRQSDEQSSQRRIIEGGYGHGSYTDAASVGDQLAVASRQARQTHVKRGYSAPAILSSRGREANQRYIDTSMSNQPRFIDEMV